jgi:hypothetical protein
MKRRKMHPNDEDGKTVTVAFRLSALNLNPNREVASATFGNALCPEILTREPRPVRTDVIIDASKARRRCQPPAMSEFDTIHHHVRHFGFFGLVFARFSSFPPETEAA